MEFQPRGIGEWLEEQCKGQGLSLRQAADKTGLSHATIRDIRHNGAASPESIKKLAIAFGGDNHEMLALEDKLLVLAGYRTSRSQGEEPSQPMARLMDLVAGFSEAELKLMARFAGFLSGMEKD
ncbi:hypothetical protein LCGC14_0262220 [marine sediment metagenome]|uniref:HTH cro/C1-type domain-containing protein n=1 Tax=marine sediment metagenome TaxID=412755 RepID=A0A0F9X5V3_9ZZZZ